MSCVTSNRVAIIGREHTMIGPNFELCKRRGNEDGSSVIRCRV